MSRSKTPPSTHVCLTYVLVRFIVKLQFSSVGAFSLLHCLNLFQDFKIEGPELKMYQNLFLGRVKKFYEMKNLS